MRGSETITVKGRVPQADVLDENTAEPGAAHQVDGCIIWPRTSNEEGGGEIVIGGFNVFVPPQADVLASDVITIRGKDHEVVTSPEDGDYRTARGRKKGKLFQTRRIQASSDG